MAFATPIHGVYNRIARTSMLIKCGLCAQVVESDPGVQNGNSTVDKLTKLLDAIDSKSSLKDPTETDVISAINNASDVLSTSDSQYFNVLYFQFFTLYKSY